MAGNVAAFEVRLGRAEHLLLDSANGVVRVAHYHADRPRRTAKASTLEDAMEFLFGAPEELHCPDTLAWYIRTHAGGNGTDLP